MKKILLTSYKGSRSYVHGSDLFNFVSKSIPELLGESESYVSQLMFSSFSYHLCELVLDEDVDKNKVMGKGIITIRGSNKKNFFLVETNETPLNRYDFDEASLVEQAVFDESSVYLEKKSVFSSIEIIIALTKALSYKNSPIKSGKWVFGRLDLSKQLPEIEKSATIKTISSVVGRFNVNSIIIDGVVVGKIQFIVGTPE